MRYAITISEMTKTELAAVTAFIESMGATPETATLSNGKGRQAVAELAAAAGATPAPPPPPAAPVNTPPASVAGDPFAQPPSVAAPVAAPSVPAPAVTAAPSPVTGDRDAKGTPHDVRFHADSKRTNNDGTWALRKGADKEAAKAWAAQHASATPGHANPNAPTAAQLNAQFAPGLPPQGATVTPPQAVTPPASVVTSSPASVHGDPFAQPAPVAPPPPAPVAPVTPQAPVAPPAPPREVTYAEWHAMYTNLMTAGKITPAQYAEISDRYGANEDASKFYADAAARNGSYADFERLAAA